MTIRFDCTSEYFTQQIQGKKPYLFKNCIKNHSVNWNLVNQLIARHDHTSSNFKLMRNGLILKHDYLEEYLEVFTRKYRVIKPKLYELLRGGASVLSQK